MKRLALLAVAVTMLAGCSELPFPKNAHGDFPRTGGPIVGSGTINVTQTLAIPLDKLFYWGVYASAAYLIIDPLAPNWEIEEARFPEERYQMSLHMKRVYAGGAGEARVVFHRRAGELMQAGGYDGYQVLEYSEGMESSALGAQRVAKGMIQLTKRND